jgi:CDP-paratose 2-epimerase
LVASPTPFGNSRRAKQHHLAARYLEEELSIHVPLQWSDWRPEDQPVFVCNLEKAKRLLEWQPSIPVRDGVGQLIRWVRDNKTLFDS